MKIRYLKDLKDVLQTLDAIGPKECYYMFNGRSNITILPPDKIGREYMKTYGHYHNHGKKELYKILSGKAIFILQKRGKKENEVERVIIKRMKVGDTITIPGKDWGHVIVNVGKSFLVTEDNTPTGPKAVPSDYLSYQKNRGATYYVIEKKGQPSLVKNPHYKK